MAGGGSCQQGAGPFVRNLADSAFVLCRLCHARTRMLLLICRGRLPPCWHTKECANEYANKIVDTRALFWIIQGAFPRRQDKKRSPSSLLRLRRTSLKSLWWRRRDLNSRPPPCEGGALPAELLPHSARKEVREEQAEVKRKKAFPANFCRDMILRGASAGRRQEKVQDDNKYN